MRVGLFRISVRFSLGYHMVVTYLLAGMRIQVVRKTIPQFALFLLWELRFLNPKPEIIPNPIRKGLDFKRSSTWQGSELMGPNAMCWKWRFAEVCLADDMFSCSDVA